MRGINDAVWLQRSYCARNVRSNSGGPVTVGGIILCFILDHPTRLAWNAKEIQLLSLFVLPDLNKKTNNYVSGVWF